MFQETLYQTVRVRDGNRTRSTTKIQALIELNVNKGLKGDLRAFAKIMDIANKLGIADTFINEQEKAEIEKTRKEAFHQLVALLEKVPPQGQQTTGEEIKESS